MEFIDHSPDFPSKIYEGNTKETRLNYCLFSIPFPPMRFGTLRMDSGQIFAGRMLENLEAAGRDSRP